MSKHFDIEAYVNENLIGGKSAGSGQIMAECPWCKRFGGFYIDRKTGHYVCHKCDERGRHLVGVISEVEGITWYEAKRFMLRNAVNFRRKGDILTLVERVKMLRSSDDDAYEGSDDVEVELPKEYRPVYDKSKRKWQYPLYLKQRGIERETAREWGLGFCNGGPYKYRVVIPISCPHGYSFTARAVDDDIVPKIKNPKDAEHGKLLLGWDMVDAGQDVALVEGPFDAIKSWQNGIPALSLMGKVLHEEQLFMLSKWPRDTTITIMVDPEEVDAPFDIARSLSIIFDNIYIAKLPFGVDPGSATREQARQAYDSAKKYDGSRHGHVESKLQSARRRMEKLYKISKK